MLGLWIMYSNINAFKKLIQRLITNNFPAKKNALVHSFRRLAYIKKSEYWFENMLNFKHFKYLGIPKLGNTVSENILEDLEL